MRTRLGAFLLLIALAALPVLAQETRGNISGTVQDSTGVIPGAVVKVTNVDTGVTQTLLTNVSGFYNAPLLNPGNYQVSVEMAGYKALIRSGVTLSVGQQLSINLALEVGSITEQVTVARRGAAHRHQHRGFGAELRSEPPGNAAGVFEYAGAAPAVRARRKRDRRSSVHRAGICRGRVHAGHPARRRGRRGVDDRRGDQRRKRPAAGPDADHGHD